MTNLSERNANNTQLDSLTLDETQMGKVTIELAVARLCLNVSQITPLAAHNSNVAHSSISTL